jgi:prepilin-type N-terminal cleavage/methylation domain-containing protein
MNQAPPRLQPRQLRRGFSIIEILVSLAITGTLLAASLVALDAAFKSYKQTVDGASTHVVSRMVMNRLMSMVRTGTEFGPSPHDVLLDPVIESTFIEFVTKDDGAGNRRIVRMERRAASTPERGPFELWYIQRDFAGVTVVANDERPMITGLTECSFQLSYDVGPRLRRATVDMTIRPNDAQDASFHSDLEVPTIRLVSSVSPRKLD